MEDVDYGSLTTLVEQHTRPSYRAATRPSSTSKAQQLVPNLANLGGHAGDVVRLNREGEYYGIAVELLADVSPLLTDHLILRVLRLLKNEDYITPVGILGVSSLEQVQYILHTWLSVATEGYNNQLKSSKLHKYTKYDAWINTVRYEPIQCPIRVVEIGHNKNTGQSVLPPDWIDREFASGVEMQAAMSKLESRIDKPPVTYAIIYSMTIQQNDTTVPPHELTRIKPDVIWHIDIQNGVLSAKQSKAINKKLSYVKYDSTLIGFPIDKILVPKKRGEHNKSELQQVGLLVSRLQKAIRRGRHGSAVLIETIERLNECPNYNLPEHGFMRVSASKQLAWRLYITIFEDVRPYQSIHEPGLLELILLAMITNRLQEYKYTRPVLDAIKFLAVTAQYNDGPTDIFDWRSEEIAKKIIPHPTSDLHNAIYLALNNMTMMEGDRRMLSKYYSVPENTFEPFTTPPGVNIDNIATLNDLGDDESSINRDIKLASYDPHCKTYIILYYQSCIPISMTTREISGYIWDVSSGYNVRYHTKQCKDSLLREIQTYFLKSSDEEKIYHSWPKITLNGSHSKHASHKFDEHTKRSSFLALFGRKYRVRGRDMVIAGNRHQPVRYKDVGEWMYSADPLLLSSFPRQKIRLDEIDAPFGYAWKSKSVTVEIRDTQPYIDDVPVKYFDGSSMLIPITNTDYIEPSKSIYNTVVQVFSGMELEFPDVVSWRNHSVKQTKIIDWCSTLFKKNDLRHINMDLIRLAYTKIANHVNDTVMIGPISRTGDKMHNSINYLMEGKLWAIFNMFCWLYPETFRPNGAVNFVMRRSTTGYVYIVDSIRKILFSGRASRSSSPPVITTPLWDHQIESRDRILSGFQQGKYGFGNASDVGAGKTLTSLAIAAGLISKNRSIHSGILVLLPGNKLLNTWQEEITRHTKGFNLILQGNTADIGNITHNTIVVTTMGRMRDHPIHHRWLLVVIDECLTVQNRNALWTEEAWKQSMMSQHMIMMSATFFRTRFDKLYYMLKMLRSGLPERKEYLDAILLETIVAQVSGVRRKWTSHIHYFDMDKASRHRYQKIEKSDLDIERKYAKLNSMMVSDPEIQKSVTHQLNRVIDKLDKSNHRCLIYARAMDEARYWSTQLNIPIYPKLGHHCIVTYHDGTYGLNDLVIYDTIVMRPPPPDKLPQIKGRLDRPGQKRDDLNLEYFVVANTIEEGLILRMNIANQFVQKYIMPLAKFYDVSINRHKYKDD